MELRYGAEDFDTDKKHIGLLPPGTYYLMCTISYGIISYGTISYG